MFVLNGSIDYLPIPFGPCYANIKGKNPKLHIFNKARLENTADYFSSNLRPHFYFLQFP